MMYLIIVSCEEGLGLGLIQLPDADLSLSSISHLVLPLTPHLVILPSHPEGLKKNNPSA